MNTTSMASTQPKICQTAGGILIVKQKILLIKHKKLGVWLNPGGHIEEKELPHQAAEREFREETGIAVQAFDPYSHSIADTEQTRYLPAPLYNNIHWISQQNYRDRLAGKQVTGKGCECHFGLFYLVKPVNSVKYTQNIEETDDIGWFTLDEIVSLETYPEVKQEMKLAFELV